MELADAKHHHASLVARRSSLHAAHKLPYGGYDSEQIEQEIKSLDKEIGRYGNAFNPRISAKAAAFLNL